MPATATRSVCLVSLGCSKNLVDSEVMAGHLGRAGITLVTDAEDASVVVVNTCGFIGDARQESIDTVLQYCDMKARGDLAGVVVTGCLVQLHQDELLSEIPEVDAFLGISDYSGVPSIVDAVLGHGPGLGCPSGEGAVTTSVAVGHGAAGGLAGGGDKSGDADLGRSLLTPSHTAYLRLGEGCDHVCAFCAIPHIRGKLASKPMDVLVEEAHALGQLGVRELTLIAEDSTDYGKDRGKDQRLADLLLALAEVDPVRWIRVMYAHPATMDERLVRAMAEVPNVAPYLDMPVQHGDASVLRAMRRGTSPERIRDVVSMVREAIPDLTLRTTILVGFPGETEQAFENLLELLDELAFDRVGCFSWSPEEATEAFGLPDHVPHEVAEARRERVMRAQRVRVEAAHRARIGSTDEVLIDAIVPRADGPGLIAVARSVRDAPEVDGNILVSLPDGAPDGWRVGAFCSVKLTGIQGYDLVALPQP